MDCLKLDPRVSVSSSVSREMEGRVQTSAGTVFRIGRVNGEIGGKAHEEIQRLVQNVPPDEQTAIKARVLYLACGMVANATDISTEKKVKLYLQMMGLKEAPIRSHVPSTAAARKTASPVSTSRTRPDQQLNKESRDGEFTTTKTQAASEVVGAEIIGNNQGDAAAEITSAAGAAIRVNAEPGQNVTGLRVVQNGPGTGLRIVNGGLKVVVTDGQTKADDTDSSSAPPSAPNQ